MDEQRDGHPLAIKMAQVFEFDCKLAHREEIKKLSNFTSIQELYLKLSQIFDIDPDKILYCTLNTHNFRDMNAIMSNYLAFGDLIIVHLAGRTRSLTIKKTQEFLGLTITDNSNGRAFVKKVNSSDKLINENIREGDHIVAINSETMIGLRHYEVAKAIRTLPQGASFTISLLEPMHRESPNNSSPGAFANLNGHLLDGVSKERMLTQKSDHSGLVSLASASDDLVSFPLPVDKLLSRNASSGNDTNPNDANGYKAIINKINTSLECFLGVSDDLLAIKIYRLAKESKDSYKAFSNAITESDLRMFNFDEDMKDQLWKCSGELTIH